MKMIEREAAMCHMLGVDSMPVSEADFPETIMLPDTVASATENAILATDKQNREYSINFSYDSLVWRAGIRFRGTMPEPPLDNRPWARTNRVHSIMTNFHPPVIRMHTHPPTTMPLVEKWATLLAEQNNWDFDTQKNKAVRRYNFSRAMKPFPSWTDIRHTYSMPAFSVSYLVASSEGSFMLVNSTPLDTSIRGIINQPVYNADKSIKSSVIEMEDTLWDSIDAPLAEQRQHIAGSIAKILSPRFICYRSESPSSTQLQRVL